MDGWPKNLLMSRDFEFTVGIPNEGNQDSFLRPVNWVLSLKGPKSRTQVLDHKSLRGPRFVAPNEGPESGALACVLSSFESLDS